MYVHCTRTRRVRTAAVADAAAAAAPLPRHAIIITVDYESIFDTKN